MCEYKTGRTKIWGNQENTNIRIENPTHKTNKDLNESKSNHNRKRDHSLG